MNTKRLIAGAIITTLMASSASALPPIRGTLGNGILSLVTVGDLTSAATISEPSKTHLAATTGASEATDLSAARRRRVYGRGGSAAGLAFMGLAIGTMGAIAAQQRRNDYYNNGYYNNGYGYGYAPGYYGGGPYYGNGYYRR